MEIKCLLCGQPIVGKYIIDHYNNCVCDKHDNVDLCFCCGRFCDSKSINISPVHKICSTCQQKRIENDSAARMLPFVYKVYEGLGFRLPGYRIKLISVSEMIKLSNTGLAEFPLGLAQKKGDQYTIYILHELSRLKFVDVIAHEILHTWQWERRILPPDVFCEGFCNFGTFLVLKELMRKHPTEETDMALLRLLKDPDEVYGDGFREIRDLYDRQGFKAVIDFIKQWQIK